MRLVLCVIIAACAIAVLIDSPRRELREQLDRDWAEYRHHVGQPSRNLGQFEPFGISE